MAQREIAAKRALEIRGKLQGLTNGKPFSGLSIDDKTRLARKVFTLMGREILADWQYTNNRHKIPFTYTSHSEEAWIGLIADQSWSKFLSGQEIQYKSLSASQRIQYIRNILNIKYQYQLRDRLKEEVDLGLRLRSQKISLYCPNHGWNEPVYLASFVQGVAKGTCTKCLKEARSDADRIGIQRITEEWSRIGRKVDPNQEYVNNRERIRFFSTKYSWPASQSWDSYDQARKKAKSRLSKDEWESYDPHDERSLIDKAGYLAKVIEDFNKQHNTNYALDPDWDPPEDLGKKSKIRVVAPEWRNYVAALPWQDFLEYNQRPILKSLINKTDYIREVFLESGRIIVDGWEYNDQARDLIPFISSAPQHEGMVFQNSWNQVSNGLGFSVQAMSNKREFYSPLLRQLGFRLLKEIDNRKALSQTLSAVCSEGHKITDRRLYDFVLAPEGFCKKCADHKPDSIRNIVRSPVRSSKRAYLYYVRLQDVEGKLFKKIGITKFSDPKLRFPSGFLDKQIELAGQDEYLSRAQVCALEYALLKSTESWSTKDEFVVSESAGQRARFRGHTELRDQSMPDKYLLDLIKSYSLQIRRDGWATFWLKQIPVSRKVDRKILEGIIEDGSWTDYCTPLP